ncbi:MAG: T9SS type A sorting domain-containing protein [Flavobacteriales bacterium]|jgi:hypothetical protein|nr:T9SS type A sorting domain-containing protein [Flavobacteriales bacterium]MBK7268060.1 T9SS type A sorting domain-containing protein [Flavobacteriales bacterium]MBK9073631.1 T9SS type A sorting domain-containing protein [Flavobacteriales bacterium]MBK9539330.1 T9SS type A sorting domain-containing protein [Flavobacteriales bacterium]
MRSLSLLFTALASIWCRAQPLAIKEQFDYIDQKLIYNGTYAGVIDYITENSGNNPWSGASYGEQVGYFLEGYLRMYETTHDKAYLIKFINLSLKAIAWRYSSYLFCDSHYQNGLLLWPMAHYIHLVEYDEPELNSLAIPSGLIAYQASTVPINEFPSASHTYGTVAAWLYNRCYETLTTELVLEWDPDLALDRSVNENASFSGPLLYLGHLSTVNSEYAACGHFLDKGALQATLFKGLLPEEDKCTCDDFPQGVLQVLPNGSYTWYHSGWSLPTDNCVVGCVSPYYFSSTPDVELYTEFIEDLSHAVTTLILPRLAHQIELYTGGNYPFTDVEMVRFRNTFTKNLWSAADEDFYNTTAGTLGPFSDNNGPNQAIGWHKYKSLAWMPLWKFDAQAGSSPNVYDIIMDFYESDMYPQPANDFGGQTHYGVAEVVSAQWENECFDLTLFNRELVYDQDFAAKDVLTVDPDGEAGASFAEPVINEPRFTVNEGITAEFRAGAAVVFEPGFETIPGSTVTAVIDPLGCDLTYRAPAMVLTGPTYANVQEPREAPVVDTTAVDLSEEIGTHKDDVHFLYDQVAHVATVRLTLVQGRSVRVELSDALGKPVMQRPVAPLPVGSHDLSLELDGLSTGIYFCKVWMDASPQVFKFIQDEN